MSHNAYIEKKLGKEIEQVSREELIALVNEMKNEKKYGLVWENQIEEMEKLLETHYPMLQEDADKAIVKDPKKPTNLIIEGDNLHSLNTLQYTHREKVDVIYIDPPYNTGNKDFVYNDRYVDKEHSWRHSAWLSFMEKRLRLGKELLSSSGIIYISIDDNELSQLKLLCDSIFGEINFITMISRIQSKGSKNDSKYFVNDKDYVLVYSKNIALVNIAKIVEKNDTKKYNKSDSIGAYKKRALEMQGGDDTLKLRPKMGYSIYFNPTTKDIKTLFDYDIKNQTSYDEPNKDYIDSGYLCFRPRKNTKGLGIWRWGNETFLKNINDIEFDIKTLRVFQKERIKEELIMPPRNTIEFTNTLGTNELTEILGKKSFSYPKPTLLIKWILERCEKRDALVLDFFAGSGTTGHAVLELNAEDGGSRQFILCTHGKENETSEVNIAEDITYERIKRVVNGYTTPKGKEVNGIDGNVKYYKTVLVEKDQDFNDLKAEMAQHAKDLLCIKDNAFSEVVSSEESFLFESNEVLMGIHLGEHYEVPDSIITPLVKTTKQKILYLKVDEIPDDEIEINVLLKANIEVKPIPKKIMDLFDENARQ